MNVDIKKVFTSDEWRILLDTPIKVGRAMMNASPSNIVGSRLEFAGLSGSVKDLEKTTSSSPLMRTLAENIKARVDDLKASEKTTAAPSNDPAESRNDALQACQQVTAILVKATPADAMEYKQYVMSVAQKVAEASGEGGFLGLTGKKISDPEQALYNDLAKALGMPPKVLGVEPGTKPGASPAAQPKTNPDIMP